MKRKICVYAICKNESKFIERWYESVKEADYVCVLDTGSTDNSVEMLKNHNIIVSEKKYENFRFDIARNDSMLLIPDDTNICVCLDLDEILVKDWSDILRANWRDNTGRARYRYTWNFNPDGSEGIVFMGDKIHKHKMFRWIHPVHEVLSQIGNEKYETISLPQIQVNHHADNTKSRSNYLPLLELSVKENPNDDRNVHYLGREYMFYQQYDKAIETLSNHLELPTATWRDERCASLRYIAKCYGALGNADKQEEYLMRAIIEADYIREPYYEAGVMYYERSDYLHAIVMFTSMLKITDRCLNYISSPECWGPMPYDYLSLCFYYLKDYKSAIEYVDIAIKLDPNDNRLLSNRKFYMLELKKKELSPS